MRVKLVTTYPPTRCGIASYSERLADVLKKMCALEVLPVERPRANPFYFTKLAFKARRDADILHIQYDCSFFGTFSLFGLSLSGMYTPLFYLLANRWGGPKIVTTVHEVQDAKKNYGGSLIYLPLHLYYSAIYRAMVALSAAVIVHTEGTVKTLAQYTAVSNASIIPLAIHVKPEIRPIESSKAKLGQAGKRVVLMFGFISPGKGHDLAIEMMLRGLPEDVVLYLAGEGRTPKDADYVRGLKEKVRSEGLGEKVFFHGYVSEEEMPIVFSAADIVLMPYHHVVQSAALSHALVYLKPVLASDIGGFAEVAREHECIETFPVGDVEALRAKLQLMLSGTISMDRLRENAARYVSWASLENVTSQTVSLYRQLIGPKQ